MKREQLRILLIEPPFYRLFKDTYSSGWYPLSLGYLAAMIMKKTNWNVKVYNADFVPRSEKIKISYLTSTGFDKYLNSLQDLSRPVWKEIKSIISMYKPTVVGISAKSPNFASVCILAKFSKEIDKKIIVIVGGPHPSSVGSEVLQSPDIDICVKGEGENTIIELLNAIETQKKFDDIKGIIYRKNSHVIENPPREFIKNLDSLYFPHESAPKVLIDYNQYPIQAFSYIMATRGCHYNCFFCGSHKIWSRKVRFRSPVNIVREIKGLQKKGLKLVRFIDDTFGVNRQYINDLCSTIKKYCPGLKWSCLFHVRLVDSQTISLMKEAGCCSIEIGIESGNNEILNVMRKCITIEEALSACSIIKNHGIDVYADFMVGFPQETEDTLSDTLAAMRKIQCDRFIYSIFTPYPGTEAFTYLRENGLINDTYDSSLHFHQSPANYFCINITPERFRMLVSKIEKIVDRKNRIYTMKQIFSLNTIMRGIQEQGVKNSLIRGIRLFVGK